MTHRRSAQHQIAGEGRHIAAGRAAEQSEGVARDRTRGLLFDGLDRQQPQVLDSMQHFLRCRSRDRPVHDFTILVSAR
jgi:hypothetical protein